MTTRFWQIFFFSLLAGVLSSFAFGVGASRNVLQSFFELWKATWLEISVAIVSGIISGGVLSLWAYFCLWDKKLSIILPLLYITGVTGTKFVAKIYRTFSDIHLGFIITFFIAHIFWILILLLAKFFAPKLEK